MNVIGLMSGTSTDGTDVAIVNLRDQPPNLDWHLLHHSIVPYSPVLRSKILAAMRPETSSVDKLSTLNVLLGEQFAQATLEGITSAGLKPTDIDLIGSHGQTLWHDPDSTPPSTLQLGCAATIFERTHIPVVSNFRANDIATGGQGAPLVAYIDKLLLTHPSKIRAAQNIGGIGNVSYLPPHTRPDLVVMAFDTGPGNVLIDEAVSRMTQGHLQYDEDGQLAQQGQVNQALLATLLKQPYLHRQPPKTTGRELFNAALLDEIWQQALTQQLANNDIIATLTALTAYSIAQAYHDFLPQMPQEVIISGGGAKNPVLMRMIDQALPKTQVLSSDEVGLPSEAKEAIIFAILAYESWHERPGSLPEATGAKRAVVLGQITR